MKLDYTERALFLLSDHHCNMKNIYLWLAGCFFGVSWVFLGYSMGVSKILQEYFNVILQCIIGVPRVLLGCFCPIEFALVAAPASVHKIVKTQHNSTQLNSKQLKSNFVGLDIVVTWNAYKPWNLTYKPWNLHAQTFQALLDQLES